MRGCENYDDIRVDCKHKAKMSKQLAFSRTVKESMGKIIDNKIMLKPMMRYSN